MKRKILSILLAGIIIISSGCQGNIINDNKKENIEVENIEENFYSVNNDGGNFSKNDLIYFIMTDRFNDGDNSNNSFSDINKDDPKAFHGGDFKGIIEKLDYIKSLGATAIWITPVVKNEQGGYHGYWTSDFYEVDPHFGTMDDLKALVNEAHEKDIKILIDHIVNHTGYNHSWLNEKKDWYNPKLNITNWNNQEQVENGWLAGLPDLDQNNPEVRKYLIDNTLWWIEQTGIDGMRLDTMKHVPKDFWNEFAYNIKNKYPDFYLLGEVWNNNPRYLEEYHDLGIDGLTNYSLYEGVRDTFTRFGKTSSLIYAIKNESNFSNPEINGLFLDNHDNKRLITSAGTHGPSYLKQALTFIMTYPAIPILYYGTEIGMEGGDDPDNRRDMEWDKVDDSEIFAFYNKLISLRESPAVKSGDFKLLDYDNYFLSYLREKDDSSIVVVMNVQNKEKNVVLNLPSINRNYQDIITNQIYNVNNKLELNLKPLDLLILKSK